MIELIDDVSSWTQWAPRPALAPRFSAAGAALRIEGGGNRYCFGRWCRRVPATPGAWYRVRVCVRWEGVEDPNLNVLHVLAWRREDRPLAGCPQDHVSSYRRDGDVVVGEGVFRAPRDVDSVEVQLTLRFSAEARATWESVTLEECEPVPPRRVKLATFRGSPPAPSTPEANRAYWAGLLDTGAQAGADLICLPECMNSMRIALPLPEVAEPMSGPTCALLSSAARRGRAYVIGCFYERDGDFVLNTAALFDRAGELVGKYRKIHPYWPEEPDGVSPGDEAPVFPLDFGTVGIMICYDSWWPETARLLALKGAEVILFPNAGYEPKLLPARALDNGVYVVAASLGSPAAIVNTLGDVLAETRVDGMVTATVDLSQKPVSHPNAGGSMNGAPAGQRAARNAASLRLHDELRAEIARWE